MANVINYAEQFSQFLDQKYAAEMKSYDLTQSNPQVQFIGAKTIRIPHITTSGYKDHTRTPGFNAGSLENTWEVKELTHDRDIELFIDPMDIDETNLVMSVANIQNVFETEQAIPEKDCYRFSKIVKELNTLDPAKVEEVPSGSEPAYLVWFDKWMSQMDDDGVPSEGRIFYITPSVHMAIKEDEMIRRSINVTQNNGAINRMVHSLDDVKIVTVPSSRFMTQYNFTDGCVPGPQGKQMHCMLLHPSSVVCRDKYSYIHLFGPGTDSRTADGYLYQNRSYGDLFVLKNKTAGIHVMAEE